MSEFQYCYWLMGIFELGQSKTFNAKQMYLIHEHLKLVPVQERKHTFCNWFEGFLDANGLEGMSEKNANHVLEKLRSEFYHVIDKSYPKELWEPLQAAHDGKEYTAPVAPVKKVKEKTEQKWEAMC